MIRRIDNVEFGTPLFISGQMHWYRPPAYYTSSRWRGTPALDGGGVLINQGIHTLDLMLHLFGGVRRVSGRLATRLHAIAVEDTAAALLEFDSGAPATLVYDGRSFVKSAAPAAASSWCPTASHGRTSTHRTDRSARGRRLGACLSRSMR